MPGQGRSEGHSPFPMLTPFGPRLAFYRGDGGSGEAPSGLPLQVGCKYPFAKGGVSKVVLFIHLFCKFRCLQMIEG